MSSKLASILLLVGVRHEVIIVRHVDRFCNGVLLCFVFIDQVLIEVSGVFPRR